MSGPSLTGRSAELEAVRAVVGSADSGRTLVVVGEPGIGKSALLSDLLGYAMARGWKVLACAGQEREAGLAFAGLRQLLRPVLTDLLTMQGRCGEALRAAAGLATPATPGGTCLAHATSASTAVVGAGLAELLSGFAGREAGVLLVVDDAQWADAASLESLACAAHGLGTEPVAMVFAARGEEPPAGLGGRVEQLSLGPLAAADASELLDAQPSAPRGRVRAQVLAQAAGNPLALAELSRAAADGQAERCQTGLPLPLTDRLSGAFAARLRELPERTRRALLLVAAANDTDLAAALSAAPDLDPVVLAPAEESGLIRVSASEVRFRHPLARSAVYYGATFAERVRAHRELAAILTDHADRHAWHLAAASRPDEAVAALLASTAVDAGRRSGATATALALARAADLTPDPAIAAARLVAAAEAASEDQQFEWAHDLATRAMALAPATQPASVIGPQAVVEPDVAAALDRQARQRSRARLVAGHALTWTARPESAAATLLPLARETTARDAPTAWKALAGAATGVYQSGLPQDGQLLADTLAAMPSFGSADSGHGTGDDRAAGDEMSAARLWVLAVTGRARAADILPWLRAGTGRSAGALAYAGATAWLLDQTDDAIELLEVMKASEASAKADGPLAVLGWAYLDAGRWDEAVELAGQADRSADSGLADGTRRLITATVAAARGQTGQARQLIARSLAANTEHSALLTARARHALGLSALSDGDYGTAFDQLRGLFAEDGAPSHQHVSCLAVGDLAAAAARSGNRLAGGELLSQIKAVTAGTQPSERVQQQFDRADSVLADAVTQDAYEPGKLAGPVGGQWPFERAMFRLEAGEWLRRRRRINEAKPVLRAALNAFMEVGATPWAHRAEGELRACGVAVPGQRPDSRRLRELTPQQQRILSLAAEGLSNREIAQRLFLSPKTVASHLYHSFPVLGVAGRHQLRPLFAQVKFQT